jgi:SAM-dependent methyltransferase
MIRERIDAINSSSHRINGDYPLTKKKKVQWLLFNLCDNFRITRVKLHIMKFPAEFNEELSTLVSPENSPSRNLCNLFWSKLDISKLTGKPAEDELSLLEVGCGSGRYAEILSSYGHKFRYVGIDPVSSSEWQNYSREDKIKFFADSADNVARYLDGVDVVITQSSLEHIENDLWYFEQLRNHAENSKKTLVSINLVPSTANLFLAPWHGIRQYGKVSISKIVRLVGRNADTEVALLGGKASTVLQFRELTWKSIKGKQTGVTQKGYHEKLVKALKRDSSKIEGLNFRNATFLAFIITFNFPQNGRQRSSWAF